MISIMKRYESNVQEFKYLQRAQTAPSFQSMPAPQIFNHKEELRTCVIGIH